MRDESDREGMRIVVEVKKGFSAEVVLNGLHVHTQLQSRFPCNLVALVNGTPCTLLLKDFLSHFLDFRYPRSKNMSHLTELMRDM